MKKWAVSIVRNFRIGSSRVAASARNETATRTSVSVARLIPGSRGNARNILEKQEIGKRCQVHASQRALRHGHVGFEPEADVRHFCRHKPLDILKQLESSSLVS